MAVLRVRQLQLNETDKIFPLAARSAGTTQQLLSIDGNSILSSVFVLAADPGMTAEVKWFQTTTGTLEEDSERQELTDHGLLTAGSVGDTNTLLVTRVHNKPVCELIITGPGTITLGVYVSIRSETASDIDSALQLDGQVVNILQDKGIPQMCYDETTGVFRFIRCNNGALQVTGSLISDEIKDRRTGTANITFDDTTNLITFSPTATKRIHRILVGGDGFGEYTVKIGATGSEILWLTLRNSWNDRQVQLPLGGKLLASSDTIIIDAKNINPSGIGTCSYEAFVYLGDE